MKKFGKSLLFTDFSQSLLLLTFMYVVPNNRKCVLPFSSHNTYIIYSTQRVQVHLISLHPNQSVHITQNLFSFHQFIPQRKCRFQRKSLIYGSALCKGNVSVIHEKKDLDVSQSVVFESLKMLELMSSALNVFFFIILFKARKLKFKINY